MIHLIHLDYADLAILEDAYAAANKTLIEGGAILLHVVNPKSQNTEWASNLIARISILDPTHLSYVARRPMRLFSHLFWSGLSIKAQSQAQTYRSLVWGGYMWITSPLALFANMLEEWRGTLRAQGKPPKGAISFTAYISP